MVKKRAPGHLFSMDAISGRDLLPALRNNVDFLFLLREDNIELRQQLWKLAGVFDTFPKFNQVFEEYTHNYGCLVFNKRTKSPNITDRVFWYRAAPSHGNWRIESPNMWMFHERHYAGTQETHAYDWSKGVYPLDSVGDVRTRIHDATARAVSHRDRDRQREREKNKPSTLSAAVSHSSHVSDRLVRHASHAVSVNVKQHPFKLLKYDKNGKPKGDA